MAGAVGPLRDLQPKRKSAATAMVALPRMPGKKRRFGTFAFFPPICRLESTTAEAKTVTPSAGAPGWQDAWAAVPAASGETWYHLEVRSVASRVRELAPQKAEVQPVSSTSVGLEGVLLKVQALQPAVTLGRVDRDAALNERAQHVEVPKERHPMQEQARTEAGQACTWAAVEAATNQERPTPRITTYCQAALRWSWCDLMRCRLLGQWKPKLRVSAPRVV